MGVYEQEVAERMDRCLLRAHWTISEEREAGVKGKQARLGIEKASTNLHSRRSNIRSSLLEFWNLLRFCPEQGSI